MTNPTVPQPEPRAHKSVVVTSEGKNKAKLDIGQDTILFSYGKPWAVMSGGVVYFPDAPRTKTTAAQLNVFYPGMPHVRQPVDQFDFIVGSVLQKHGLFLTTKDA